MARKVKDELLVRARGKVEEIWNNHKEQGLVGRCWGKHFNGSTIVIGNGSEMVVVSLDQQQQLQFHEFSLTSEPTRLGGEVRRLLETL